MDSGIVYCANSYNITVQQARSTAEVHAPSAEAEVQNAQPLPLPEGEGQLKAA